MACRRRLRIVLPVVLAAAVTVAPPAAGGASANPPTTTTTVPSLLDQLARLFAPPTSAVSTPTTTTTAPAGGAPPSRFFLQEGSPEDARLLDLIAEADTARRDVERRIEGLRASLANLQREHDTVREQLAGAEDEQRRLSTSLAGAGRLVDGARADLARRAVAAYVGEPAAVTRHLNSLLGVREASDMGIAAAYLRASFGSTTEMLKQHRARHAELEALSGAIADAQGLARSKAHELEARQAVLDTKTRELTTLRGQLEDQQATEQQLRGQVFASRDEFERRMAVFAEESAALTAQLRNGDGSGDVGAPGGGRLAAPLAGAHVSSGFGPRVHPIFGDVREHTGVDLGAPQGTPISAAGSGRVVSAGATAGYGNLTVIQHTGAVTTLYAHQSEILVQAGQEVRTGDVIGLVGCTGYCTGPHLHLEVRVDGVPVDPAPWFS